MPANHTNTDQAVTRREHNVDTEAKRIQFVDPFGGVVTEGNFAEKKVILQVGSVKTIYSAIAQIGTPLETAEWQVYKLVVDETEGTVITKTWADGDDLFNNTADDLVSLTYI